MKQLILAAFCLFMLGVLTSCGGLPIDKSPAPIDYDHYLLEMHYEEIFEQGLLSAKIDFTNPGESELEIPVFGKGEVSITSKRCIFSETKNFGKKTKMISYSIEKLIKNVPEEEFGCIFNIFLFVEGLDRGMQGQFYLMKDQGHSDLEFRILNRAFNSVGGYQFSDTTNFNLPIEFMAGKPGIMFYEGCGVSEEFRFESDPSVKLIDLLPEKKSCIVTVGVIYDDGDKALAEVNLKVFSRNVLEIADPGLVFDGDTLKVSALKPVGIVGIDGNLRKGTYIKRKVGNKEVFVRLVTANGRYKLLTVKRGVVQWRASIKY